MAKETDSEKGIPEKYRWDVLKSKDGLDWYSAKEEGLGNLYEGLLEKNANEKKYSKSGADM